MEDPYTNLYQILDPGKVWEIGFPQKHEDEVMQHLEEHGYVVIPNVISATECDKYAVEYMKWWNKFEDSKPKSKNSLIRTYGIGHFESTWNIRLNAKPVFAKIWQTKKLLTSFEGIALGEPPETSDEHTRDPGDNWFHIDQGARKRGLHAFQSAVYLEETTESDWCFRVLDGSHKFLEQFYTEHRSAAMKTADKDFCKLGKADEKWYLDNGCLPTIVPCPKGGMILWDSRTVHDNTRPIHGRPNPERWRIVTFVCMTPAKWATTADKHMKLKAYSSLMTTTNWPSRGISVFSTFIPPDHAKYDVALQDVPPKALTDEVKLLAGVKNYDFRDGESNGPVEPD